MAVAALSLAQQLFQASRPLAGQSSVAAPLSSTDEATVASIAPLLLAAETAAAVDETGTLSSTELEELELDLRMLITNMDAQLTELQDSLAETLPSSTLESLERVAEELAAAEDALAAASPGAPEAGPLEAKLATLRWQEFEMLTAHAGSEEKRSYRSLLYNRGVQAQLLRQVESQAALRGQMAALERQLAELETAPSSEQNAAQEQCLRLGIAGAAVPHPRKAATGGEDAFYVSNEHGSFGVADGVGGWAANGVDPSEYPRLLMAACHARAGEHTDPLAILRSAFAETHAPGSCTVALASLQGDTLRVTSLGDCGTRVVRNGRVIFASDIQEHKWNQPYQLASPKFYVGDAPHDAHQYSVTVEPGDVVVLGSDGLWDNLHDHELEEELVKSFQAGGPASDGVGVMDGTVAEAVATRLAADLCTLAAAHSRDSRYPSPFAAEKQEQLLPAMFRGVVSKAVGGKLDDITVVAAVVY